VGLAARAVETGPVRRTRRLAAVVALSLSMMGAVMAQASQTTRPRLVFGIYPGGGVGTVGPGVAAKPESAEMQLAALRRLRGAQRRFVLHLYAAYEGDAPVEQAAASAAAESAYYATQGFDVELVLRYRPKSRDAATAAPGFAAFTRRVVALLGRNPRLVGVQITNEPNVPGHPDASDGDYPGVVDALVRGVVAAKADRKSVV